MKLSYMVHGRTVLVVFVKLSSWSNLLLDNLHLSFVLAHSSFLPFLSSHLAARYGPAQHC